MRRDVGYLNLPIGEAPSAEQGRSIMILAVGDLEGWIKRGQRLPLDGNVAFVEFSDVTDELFQTFAPSVVLSPLLAHGFDCIDLAQVLCRLGFKGRYRAMAERLPDPHLIEAEIGAMCPALDFGILTFADQPGYLAN